MSCLINNSWWMTSFQILIIESTAKYRRKTTLFGKYLKEQKIKHLIYFQFKFIWLRAMNE